VTKTASFRKMRLTTNIE